MHLLKMIQDYMGPESPRDTGRYGLTPEGERLLASLSDPLVQALDVHQDCPSFCSCKPNPTQLKSCHDGNGSCGGCENEACTPWPDASRFPYPAERD